MKRNIGKQRPNPKTCLNGMFNKDSQKDSQFEYPNWLLGKQKTNRFANLR